MGRKITKERFINKVIRHPLTYIVLISLFVLFTYSAISTYKNSKIAGQKTRQVETDLERLKNQEANLVASLNDMNTDFGVEKSLREKFGIIKEGEVAVIIIEDEEVEEAPIERENKGFWNFLRNIF
jgi:cell division protein FtsB